MSERAPRSERQGAHRSRAPAAKGRAPSRVADPLSALQERFGNRAGASVLQAKLRVSEPGDAHELEADRVAEEAMRGPIETLGARAEAPPDVQRKCSACASSAARCSQCEERDVRVHAKRTASALAQPSAAARAHVPSGGRPLSSGARAFFEPRFGRDFSTVRVHDGAAAADSARALGALAYTVGSDIVFAAGQYAPETDGGKKLLAHELAHTVQQESASSEIRRRAMPFDPASIAQQLRDAMEGWGTDEESIYAALSGRTREQTDAIAAAYQHLTGRDLQADLQDELTSAELLKLGALAPTAEDDPERRAAGVAERLRGAMAGLGTDEAAIYAALNGRSTEELTAIKAAYVRLIGRELLDDLRDELSGDELERALGAMGVAPTVFEHNTELGMLSVGNFDFHFRNCAILIWVWLRFKFENGISAKEQTDFKSRFLGAVHAKWAHSGYSLTGSPNCPCTSVPIEVHAEENSGSYYHKLVDVERTRAREMVISDINVSLGTDDLTLAHEFGHVLGLYDEYDGGFVENCMFWHRNRPDDPNALMNQGTELRARYFEHYRARAQATAPAGCQYTASSPTPPV